MGRHTLNIHGTLIAPENLSADLNHYVAWVIGPQNKQLKGTEWVWLGWEKSKFSFLTVVSRDQQIKKKNSHFKLVHHRSEDPVHLEHQSFSNFLHFQKSKQKHNPWMLRLEPRVSARTIKWTASRKYSDKRGINLDLG